MIDLKQTLLNGFYRSFHAAGLMPIVRRVLGNRGVILMFHEIQERPSRELMTGSDITLLSQVLVWLKNNGWEIVSLDEGLRRLTKEDGGPRFAVLTFDDGYRDNAIQALPILELHDAPFTIFVPTGSPTRTLYSWWLGLRALFRMCDSVTVDAMDRRFECRDLASKTAALAKVTQWVHFDLRRAWMLAPTFATAGISLPALNDTYFLDENELKEIARHRLASVGAHTTSHAALLTLEPTSVRREMSDNRYYLEQLLLRPIKHFAYPYGGREACSEREEKIAAEVGFLSAVTTRSAPLTTAHRSRPLFLPRIGFSAKVTTAGLDGRVSGLQAAIVSGLRAAIYKAGSHEAEMV
jgi:peptidoglycan/xylan/chitin deacetylase (PgdA/CDA1 family)